jgi:acyl-CoA synthetase (AMP-forming)/AMP-acid ligase II
MSFLLAVLCLFLPPAWVYLLSLLFPARRDGGTEQQAKGNLAEIEGPVWERMSVFEHIERGLKMNPNEPAVISTFQSANHLNDLVSQLDKRKCHSTLWQKDNGDSNYQNKGLKHGSGNHSQQSSEHQNLVLWSSRQSPTRNVAKTSPTCLLLTYSQLHHTATKLAFGLLANGAQPNTTLLMLIPNGGEYALLLWTCVLLRITYVSLDPASLDISGFTALKHTLRMLKPQIVVAPDTLSGKALDVAMSELLLPEPIRISLSKSQTHNWKTLVDIAADAGKCTVESEVLVAAARKDNPDRIHSIMFTSGTSGLPKGCPLRVGGMSHVLQSQSWLVTPESGVVALQQPHNSRGIAPAQTLQTWKAGGAVVMTGQQFNVLDALKAIRQFSATFIVLTPPMVHEIAAEMSINPLDISSVKTIQVGGDAVTKGVLTKCSMLFPTANVCVNHGMTEGGGAFAWPFFSTPVSSIPFFGEICPIGAVAPGTTIRLWDTEKKCLVGKGELGELHISSPSIIKHYLGGRSEDSFHDDRKGRWFKTGDIAMVNRNGIVYILGRKKDMIKRAGVAIMPAAIESSIEAFTGAQVRSTLLLIFQCH